MSNICLAMAMLPSAKERLVLPTYCVCLAASVPHSFPVSPYSVEPGRMWWTYIHILLVSSTRAQSAVGQIVSHDMLLGRWRVALDLFGRVFCDDVGAEPGSIISELGGFPIKESRFRREMEKLRNNFQQRDLILEVSRGLGGAVVRWLDWCVAMVCLVSGRSGGWVSGWWHFASSSPPPPPHPQI